MVLLPCIPTFAPTALEASPKVCPNPSKQAHWICEVWSCLLSILYVNKRYLLWVHIVIGLEKKKYILMDLGSHFWTISLYEWRSNDTDLGNA